VFNSYRKAPQKIQGYKITCARRITRLVGW